MKYKKIIYVICAITLALSVTLITASAYTQVETNGAGFGVPRTPSIQTRFLNRSNPDTENFFASFPSLPTDMQNFPVGSFEAQVGYTSPYSHIRIEADDVSGRLTYQSHTNTSSSSHTPDISITLYGGCSFPILYDVSVRSYGFAYPSGVSYEVGHGSGTLRLLMCDKYGNTREFTGSISNNYLKTERTLFEILNDCIPSSEAFGASYNQDGYHYLAMLTISVSSLRQVNIPSPVYTSALYFDVYVPYESLPRIANSVGEYTKQLYELGYDDGYTLTDEAIREAFDTGVNEGRVIGRQEGEAIGFEKGYKEGTDLKERGLFGWFFDSATALLTFEILPGFSIGGFFAMLIGLFGTVWILKVLGGG